MDVSLRSEIFVIFSFFLEEKSRVLAGFSAAKKMMNPSKYGVESGLSYNDLKKSSLHLKV